MKSLPLFSLDRATLWILLVLVGATMGSMTLMPRAAHASAVTVSALTATSTPAYTNTGLATTTRAKVTDTIQYQLTLSGGAPLIAPQINILGTGSTTMSGAGNSWWYATTTTAVASVWNDGLVTFKISVGNDTAVGNATTTVTALTSGSNITFDKTGPSLNSVSWSDADSSTEFSAGDVLTVTFNETMATSTITAGNVDTTLGLSGSHTFGTSPTVSWNTAGTVLTLMLGSSPTLATADTVDPTTAVKDAIGNNDATPTPVAITDNISPNDPVVPTDIAFHGPITVSLSSSGSSQIRYTTDGSTPTCSTGSVYSSAITVSDSTTLKVVGCDEAGNVSGVVSATYTHSGSSGGGSSSSSWSSLNSASANNTALQSQINSLLATIAALQAQLSGMPSKGGIGATVSAIARDLTVGATGDDVKALQMYLNTHGAVIATTGPGSAGSETTTFGALTRAALAKFQAANGITPASGYCGPKTRAYLANH